MLCETPAAASVETSRASVDEGAKESRLAGGGTNGAVGCLEILRNFQYETRELPTKIVWFTARGAA